LVLDIILSILFSDFGASVIDLCDTSWIAAALLQRECKSIIGAEFAPCAI